MREDFLPPTKPWSGNAAWGVEALDQGRRERLHPIPSRRKPPTPSTLFAEWFFAGFTRVTGTPTNAEDKSEVYDVSYQRHI
jgi:hypothetical protein